jgi:hypothetical protein
MIHMLISDLNKVEKTAKIHKEILPECIYNPITAMGFSTMFTFQLDKTKVNIAGTPLL